MRRSGRNDGGILVLPREDRSVLRLPAVWVGVAVGVERSSKSKVARRALPSPPRPATRPGKNTGRASPVVALARVDFLDGAARLALDVAAPDELAVAALGEADGLGVVAAAAAEDVAAVRPGGVSLALSPCRAESTCKYTYQ
jgi:hypothetical protein